MKKILVFSILLLSAIAVTTGTTITTTIQIQPAYSQAQQFSSVRLLGDSIYVTTGQNPSVTFCPDSSTCLPSRDITHQEAGQLISRNHQACVQGFAECTVTHH